MAVSFFLACAAAGQPFRTGMFRKPQFHIGNAPLLFDFPTLPSNNPPMARPSEVRRVKSYSASNGYVYQYCFYEVNRISEPGGPAGEFIYAISTDRKTSYGVRIVVHRAALEAWAKANGRPLTISEEYAVAKMRLFQAFDENELPATTDAGSAISLVVDESNLEALLQQLNI
jgi:hypothetical protein